VSSSVTRVLPDLGLVLALGLVGTAIELLERGRLAWRRTVRRGTLDGGGRRGPRSRRGRPPDRDDRGIPLALLVVSVGEGPRHEIAAIAILVALGSAGWVRAIRRAATADRVTLAAAGVGLVVAAALAALTLEPVVDRRLVVRLGLVAVARGRHRRARLARRAARRRRRVGTALVAVALGTTVAAALVVASVVVPARRAHSTRAARRPSRRWATGPTRTSRPARRSSRPPPVERDGPAARGRLPAVTRERRGGRPAIGDGAARSRGPGRPAAADDWVALRESPLDVTTLYGYRASTIADRLRGLGPTVWIESELTGPREVSPIVDALSGADGVRVAGSWSWPYGDQQLRTTAFEIDPDRLRFPETVVLTSGALERIVTRPRTGSSDRPAPAAALLGGEDRRRRPGRGALGRAPPGAGGG
jgi:hypothetical protein